MGKKSREKRENRETREPAIAEKKFTLHSRLEKRCLFIIRWGTYLMMFTPIIISTKFFFPFVAPKTTFFRIIAEIIFAAYLFLVISHSHKYRPRINALTISLFLFLAVFIFASFTGVNLERSFWSTYERMTGIWTMLHLFTLFIILASCFKKREDWEKFLAASVIVGVFLSLYIFISDQASTRGGGTIGNTSFLGTYLLFDVFFAIILFLSKRGVWQIFSGICLMILLPTLLNSTARGAIFAFYLGLFFLLLGYMLFSKKRILKRIALGIIGTIFVLIVFLAIFHSASPVQNKIASVLYDMKARFVVWEAGWKGFLERPILGWGPENFLVVFSKYFNSCMALDECGGEIWFDRVHNIVLDTLVTTGIIGFLVYLSILGVATYGLLAAVPKIIEKRNIFIPLGLISLLFAYFIQNLLVFDMINSYLVFFLTLGFVDFLTQKPQGFQEEKTKSINPLLGLVIIVAILLPLWWGNIQPMVANYYIIKTYQTRNIDEVTSLFQKSLSSSMNKHEAREYFSQRMVKASYENVPEEGQPSFQKAFDLAEAEMKKSVGESPLDYRSRLFLGEIYAADFRFNKNEEKAKKAEEALKQAIALSPTNQQTYWELGEVLVNQGKVEEAIPLLRQAIDLDQRLGNSHWYLSVAYKILGQYALSREEIIKAKEMGFNWWDNLDALKEVIKIYFALNDDENLIPLYLEAIEVTPNDAQLWASLAASYANLGQFDNAREAAQKVPKIDPELAAEVQSFLKNLPQQ